MEKQEVVTEEGNQDSVGAWRPGLFQEGIEAKLNKDREAATEFGNIKVVIVHCESW